ncbi:MAG: DUF2283 domain-containing protein [Elainellaceae cyanobacterium]
MKIEFDPEVDAAYLRLSDADVIDSEEIATDIVYDFDADEQIVGIELLQVRTNLPYFAVVPLPFQKVEQQVEFISFLETIAEAELRSKLVFAKQILQNQTAFLQRI